MGSKYFLCSAYHGWDCQPYPVDACITLLRKVLTMSYSTYCINRGRGKIEAHKNWSLVIPKKAAHLLLELRC